MRTLITGAAGFLGSHLAERLVAEGDVVYGVDNLTSGRLTNLSGLAREPRFDLIRADVTEPLPIRLRVDRVLHLASVASPPRYSRAPVETLRANAEGTRHLLDLARASRASMLFASTSEVYGDPLVHPQPESYAGNVDPVGARSMYDEGKRYGEALTVAYARSHGVRTSIARIFNTYGPRMDPDDGRVVPTLIRQALAGEPLTVHGDGTQTRSFVFVDDLIDGLARLSASGHPDPMNLGSPDEVTVIELARIVLRVTGSSSEIVSAPRPAQDPERRRPDIMLARRVLGWHPRVGLEDGIARTVVTLSEVL